MRENMNHNDYIFSTAGGSFKLLRRFEDMYKNCEDPHGQSKELETVDYGFVSTVLMRVISQLQTDGRPARILDLGCGLGFFTSHMKEMFPSAEISGCDISTTAVEKAAANAPKCRFFPADLTVAAKLPKNTYDILVALNVLYYFTEKEIADVVHNLHQLSEERGYLLVGYHLPKEMNFGRYIRNLADAKALFEPNGFRFCLTWDVVNDLDKTYADTSMGRHIYFLAQRNSSAKRKGDVP